MYENFEIQFRKKLLNYDKMESVDKSLKKVENWRATPKKFEKMKNFNEILSPIVIAGNIFGIFPIAGICSRKVEKLKFQLCYPITIYSMIMIFLLVLEVALLIVFFYRGGLQFFMIGQTVFTLVCTFGATYFFYLSTKWKSFMASWWEHERHFLVSQYCDKISATYVQYKIWCTASLVILFSLVDHFVYLLSAIENTQDKIGYCEPDKRDFWRILFVNERQVFFLVMPYHDVLLPFLEWYEVVKQMCWTFSEVFVSSFAIILAARFKQLTNRLKQYEGQHMGEIFWNEIREHYNLLCNMVLKADKFISPVILFYSFGNMFFICQKIFMQFERKKMPWDRYYSYYSSLFLITRMTLMLYFCSEVNERSRDVLKILRQAPNQSYQLVNYHRLLDVLHSNKVALSGYRFFYVTKSMILALAGTVLTYELVLVQQIDDIEVTNKTTNACGEVTIGYWKY